MHKNKICIIHLRTLLMRDNVTELQRCQQRPGYNVDYKRWHDMEVTHTAEVHRLDLTLIFIKGNCWTVPILEYCMQALLFIFSRWLHLFSHFGIELVLIHLLGKLRWKQMKISNVHENRSSIESHELNYNQQSKQQSIFIRYKKKIKCSQT